MTRQITSPSNPLIKEVRKLRNKKDRDLSQSFYVEGIQAVGKAINSGYEVQYIIYCPDLLNSEYGYRLIENLPKDFPGLIEVTRDVFNLFALKEGPQGLAAIVIQKWFNLSEVKSIGDIWIALDSIQDPGNVGTILRSLDAIGGEGAILLGQTTDAYHPSSVRASTGAIFTQKLIRSDARDFRSCINLSGFSVVGAVCGGGQNYRKYNYPSDLILLMGSEQKGLSGEYMAICNALVTIPIEGHVDSLNVAVAASLILFEIFNQKRG